MTADAPQDPPPNPNDEPPPRLFSPAYWIAIGFGLVCIVAAAAVAFLGPRVFPAKPPHLAPAAATAK